MYFIRRIFESSLFKTSGIYTFTSFFNNAISFFLIPILTRYLAPEDYGIISMFQVLLSIGNVVVGLNVHGAISRAYFDREKINFRIYVANCIYILIITTLFLFIFVYLCRNYIYELSSVPQNWIPLAILISFFYFIILAILSIYQAQMNAKAYSTIMIAQSFINLLLSVFLVVVMKLAWKGRIIGQLISVSMVGILSFYLLNRNWVIWKINKNYISHALNFGVPLVPHALAGLIQTATDRVIISNVLSLKDTGIYTIGLQIGMILELLFVSFNKDYCPLLFEKLNLDNYDIKQKIVKFTYIYFLGAFLLGIASAIILTTITSTIVGKGFQNSKEVIPWICIASVFNGLYYMVVNYIFYVYKTHLLSLVTFCTSFLNIPITYFLVKIYSIQGAAISLTIINLLSFVFTFYLSSKVYKMPWIFWRKYETIEENS